MAGALAFGASAPAVDLDRGFGAVGSELDFAGF